MNNTTLQEDNPTAKIASSYPPSLITSTISSTTSLVVALSLTIDKHSSSSQAKTLLRGGHKPSVSDIGDLQQGTSTLQAHTPSTPSPFGGHRNVSATDVSLQRISSGNGTGRGCVSDAESGTLPKPQGFLKKIFGRESSKAVHNSVPSTSPAMANNNGPNPSITFTSAETTTKEHLIPKDYFPKNVPKPAVRSVVPVKLDDRIDSTSQLVFCISLLPKDPFTSTSAENDGSVPDVASEGLQDVPLNEAERDWLDAIKQDPEEQEHLRWMVSKLVAEFVKHPTKNSKAIAEAVILGPVLNRADYRTLLLCFIEKFEDTPLLDVEALQGIVQLVQCASPLYLENDDLLKILKILGGRLQGTHKPSTNHMYHLILAISKILEAMVTSKIKDLDRTQDHQPLLKILSDLRSVYGETDPYLKFLVKYAYQTLLYFPDDETLPQAIWRYTQPLAIGASGVASLLKLDLKNTLSAAEHVQQVAGNAIGVVKSGIEGFKATLTAGEGAFQCAKKLNQSGERQEWYLAVQAMYTFVRNGQLVEFNQAICKARCRSDRNFQQGVCQILGEIAVDPLLDITNRQYAIDFLGKLYKNNSEWGNHLEVKKWILSILHHIYSMELQNVKDYAGTLLERLCKDDAVDINGSHPLSVRLLMPEHFPLLGRVLDIPYVEHDLHKLKIQRLGNYCPEVYIPPQARANPQAPEIESLAEMEISPHTRAILQAPDNESFPLMEKVQEFLQSEQQVFLVLGDSGAGKSTFNRHLERELWRAYEKGDTIPLFIDLPTINSPDQDLVAKQLRRHNFSESQIQEMKQHRKFVLICDGYDESRLETNIHTTNQLNRPGQWDTKMVISCRCNYLRWDYSRKFKPQTADTYALASNVLFQEVLVVPFSEV
ncbi:hypothetical protein BGZ58_008204 [Dissophora ornata]|nr:hypothetical protein BGZ58_008204 [Dissophora ornata]